MSPKRSAIPDATCRGARASARWRSSPSTSCSTCCSCTCCPVGQLAKVTGSVLDVVADRLLGPRAGDVMARGVDRQHRGEHQRDGLRRAARLLRDGARRRVLQERRAHPSAIPHARGLDRRPGGLERPARPVRRRERADDLHRFLGRAVRGCRRALAVRPQAARARAPRPFKAIGFPVAPAIFALASALIVCNALYSDLVVPIRHGTAWVLAAAGLIVIGLGLPVYLVFRRRSRAAAGMPGTRGRDWGGGSATRDQDRRMGI